MMNTATVIKSVILLISPVISECFIVNLILYDLDINILMPWS